MIIDQLGLKAASADELSANGRVGFHDSHRAVG
jgi:hypothetical protein